MLSFRNLTSTKMPEPTPLCSWGPCMPPSLPHSAQPTPLGGVGALQTFCELKQRRREGKEKKGKRRRWVSLFGQRAAC